MAERTRIPTYWSETLQMNVTIPDPDRVPEGDGCACGERRAAWLVRCGDDSPFVECQSCHRQFIPGEVASVTQQTGRFICAWCGRDIGPSGTERDDHRICGECGRKHREQAKEAQ